MQRRCSASQMDKFTETSTDTKECIIIMNIINFRINIYSTYKINECTLLLLIVRDKTSGEDGCGVGSN